MSGADVPPHKMAPPSPSTSGWVRQPPVIVTLSRMEPGPSVCVMNPRWGSVPPPQSMMQAAASPLRECTSSALPSKERSRLPGPVKVPSSRSIVSPGAAACSASWRVGKSPVPSGLMKCVPAEACTREQESQRYGGQDDRAHDRSPLMQPCDPLRRAAVDDEYTMGRGAAGAASRAGRERFTRRPSRCGAGRRTDTEEDRRANEGRVREHAAESGESSPVETSYVRRYLTSSRGSILIAERESRVVGLLSCSMRHPPPERGG